MFTSWGPLGGPRGALLGQSRGRLGRIGALLHRLGALLDRLGGLLGPSWPVLGPSWARKNHATKRGGAQGACAKPRRIWQFWVRAPKRLFRTED